MLEPIKFMQDDEKDENEGRWLKRLFMRLMKLSHKIALTCVEGCGAYQETIMMHS